MKVECVMKNERIDGLAIDHSLAPLFKQEGIWVLDAKEMESSFKIDLGMCHGACSSKMPIDLECQ
jgi:hypothetical protein